jgi:hypothetical protein
LSIRELRIGPRNLPCCRIHTVEHGYNQGRVVHLEPSVQTCDLQNCRDTEQNYGKNRGSVPKLIAGILVRKRAGEQLYAVTID